MQKKAVLRVVPFIYLNNGKFENNTFITNFSFLKTVKLMPPDYRQEVKDLLILPGKKNYRESR